MGFPMPGAFLSRMADAFAAGLLPLFEAAAGVAMSLKGGQRRNGHGFENSRIRHGRTQGFQRAVKSGARLLLVALRIGDLPGEVAEFANGLDGHHELGNIRQRAERLDIGIDLGEFLLRFGRRRFRVLNRAGLPAPPIEQAAKGCHFGLGGNPRNHLIDATAPFKFGREAKESGLGCRKFGAALGKIGFAGPDLNAHVTKLRDVFGTREQAVIEDERRPFSLKRPDLLA
jgi:hypothetical protein